jgi:hypothetical protein
MPTNIQGTEIKVEGRKGFKLNKQSCGFLTDALPKASNFTLRFIPVVQSSFTINI